MAKKIISIDIDDVLADSAKAFVAFSNKHWGTTLTVDDYTEDWAKMWQVERNDAGITEVRNRAEKYMSHIVNHDSLNAYDALVQLKKTYDLIVVTSRRTSMKGDTLKWIESHFPNIFKEDKIYFAGMWDTISFDTFTQTKGDILNSLGADYHIDDQPKHCLAALKHRIQPLLFGDYSWNRDEELPDEIVRVKNWSAVLRYFESKQEA